MTTEREVKDYMRGLLLAGECIDPTTGEVMLTQLAEAAAWALDLDLDDELPFELAYAVGEQWETMHGAGGPRGAANALSRRSSRALEPPDAVQ